MPPETTVTEVSARATLAISSVVKLVTASMVRHLPFPFLCLVSVILFSLCATNASIVTDSYEPRCDICNKKRTFFAISQKFSKFFFVTPKSSTRFGQDFEISLCFVRVEARKR